MNRAALLLALFVTVLFSTGCAPPPSLTFDYRWQILEAEVWQPNFRESQVGTGILFQWTFDKNARRTPQEFNSGVAIWRYPLDTVLVVTKKKEDLPLESNGTHEVTRMYYDIRGNAQRFEVPVTPEENVVGLVPGIYFIHLSPSYYSDVRIKDVEVKAGFISIVKVNLTITSRDAQ